MADYINPMTGQISTSPSMNMDSMWNAMNSLAVQNNAASLEAAERQNAFQVAQNAKAMSFNEKQAEINRNWQEYMSNTAHQREVKDLIAAGLNPILSANSGASTPAGSVGSGVTSAGAKADIDMNRTNALTNILQSIMSADVARENAALNATTSMHNADVNAKAVTDAAAIAASATRYMADHPNSSAGLLRIVLEGITGQGLGSSARSVVDTVHSALDNVGSIVDEKGLGETLKETAEDFLYFTKSKLGISSKDKPDYGNQWL